MHIKEDTSKPENRVNLSLFHLLMFEDFSEYIKRNLDIDLDTSISPSPNLVVEEFKSSMRPDFVIKKDNEVIGYIEVELGKENQAQLNNYRTNTILPVYSIVGKKSYNQGDISLDDLYYFLSKKSIPENSQLKMSIELFTRLIKYYVIDGNFTSSSRVEISDKIRHTTMIQALFNFFGKDRIIENCSVEKGKLMINSVGEGGFSIRVYSVNTGSQGLSLMNRTGGRKIIYFPSYKKLFEYLPFEKEFCNNYAKLISKLGYKEVFHIEMNKKAKLNLDIVEDNHYNFFSLIEKII